MKIIRIMISILLAALFVSLAPAQVFADSQVEYIAEIKIGMDKNSSDAAAALEGYTILSDSEGNYVDLNDDAGGGFGSKGDKVVYLGYKTTTDRSEAITDLAVMNMKGGYSVQDYEILMETQMKSQIIPFVENFVTAIQEYRENYASDIEEKKARADQVHNMLNKLLDDDTGKPLGDLFLNETKYELGDKAYDALSEEEKKNHADILTITAQANGRATLSIFKLLTLGADSLEDNWLDRLSSLTIDDLYEAFDLTPSDAAAQLDKIYYDTAHKLLGMWDEFRGILLNTDETGAALEEAVDNEEAIDEGISIIENFDPETADSEDVDEYLETIIDVQNDTGNVSQDLASIAAKLYLEEYEYGDGTLYDFFTTPEEEVSEDIRMLYPLVASLTPGQIAGLDYVTLQELVMVAGADDFDGLDFDETDTVSIYDGVDRAIYAKGGVALTSDALRTNAALVDEDDSDGVFSVLTWVMAGFSAATAIAFGVSVFAKIRIDEIDAAARLAAQQAAAAAEAAQKAFDFQKQVLESRIATNKMNLNYLEPGTENFNRVYANLEKQINEYRKMIISNNTEPQNIAPVPKTSPMAQRLMIGFGVAMVLITAYTTYSAYRDLVNHYKVNFTPIPHYMVDEKDITAFNDRGEKIVIKNQSAYYKAVECNRTASDEYFDTVGTCADLNGDVGKQWLALYTVKNEAENPILASSLKVVTGSTELPAGYGTGIHAFGSETAFNLNNTLYIWNSSAKTVFVYFQRDVAASVSEAGTAFSSGVAAITGVAGLAIGAAAAVIIVKLADRKKKAAAPA